MEPSKPKFDCLLNRGVLLIDARNMQVLICSKMLTDIKMQVTWVEHSEYDESAVHQLYRPILSSGRGFGAQRWLAALQRYYEGMAMIMSPSILGEDQTGLGICSILSLLICLFSRINIVCAVLILCCNTIMIQ
jgi:hypothetical protein